ncbi:hypothetical protein MKK84_05695 [Methylobacterium sp. E-065]|nr:hypothetical protein [Methylobacterium sp. E-065]MCJ2016922.1 hypothetical protein [Methylobacterium sp. E-065]
MTITASVLFLMPVLLTALTLAVGEPMELFPIKDDLWQLPRPSSLL